VPAERLGRALDLIRPRGRLVGAGELRLAAWAAVVGVDVAYDGRLAGPHGAMVRRDWRDAADGFAEVGWTYDRALVLSLLDDEEALAEALEIARGLAAGPLARRVTRSMRRLDFSVPRGPRVATRSNPAGLTSRQLEVLALLVEGLTNAEIAERLVVSPRTAEHHVTAVLAKLGATTRGEAARRAAELRLVMPG
jgi:DNA-binding CsgD family transcriptional regulator